MHHPRPNAFINVVAWLFIVLAGIGILTGVLQNLAVHFWPPLVEVLEQTRQSDTVLAPEGDVWSLVMSNLRWVLAFNLLLAIVVFAAGVGLLRRRNWARLVFVFLLSLVILLTLGNVLFALQAVIGGEAAAAATDPYAPAIYAYSAPSLMASALFSLLLCLLLGWMVWQLCRAKVTAEFRN